MLVAFAPSIPALTKLGEGIAYLLGISFVMNALGDFRTLSASQHSGGSVKGGYWSAFAYLFMGTALIYLPSAINTMEVTLFGTDSPLSYTGEINAALLAAYGSAAYIVVKIIELAGLFFFIRGCVLMANSSDPEVKHGWRGFVFLIAGVFAINCEATLSMLQASIESLVSGGITLYPVRPTLDAIFSSN